MSFRHHAWILALAIVIFASCKRPDDQAAKARIFSPEEPQGSSAIGQEKLDARRLADDPRLAERVLGMSQAEMAERLGPHKAQTRVQFAWFRGPGLPDGGTDVSLAEETALVDGSKGDFTVKLSNDHNQGFEVVWAKGEVFVRSLFGPFRRRRTDRTDPARVREDAMAALPTFDRLSRGLKLRLAGETSAEGRAAIRYTVSGFGAHKAGREERAFPPPQFPEPASGKATGPDPDTARRLELWEREEPTQISGTLLVDAETAAPLACDLQGHFKVAASSTAAPAAELDLHSVLTTQAVGRDAAIKAPQFEVEPAVPHAVKDPLRFLGKQLQPKAAGAAPADEPVEEDDEPETPADEAPKR